MPFTRVRTLLSDGSFGPERSYSLPPDEAVVAAAEQDRGNMNTWHYPTPSKAGVRASTLQEGVKILDAGKTVYAGFPDPDEE